jgi:hypothetical protein
MIRELVAIAGKSNEARNGGTPVTNQARHIVERLHHRAADLFHPGTQEGQVQLTPRTVAQRQSKPKRAVEGKRSAQKDPKEVIPFQEDKEDDKQVLRRF